MLSFRLGAAGAPTRTIFWLLVEIWFGFSLAIALIIALSLMAGPSQAAAAQTEAAEFVARWARLTPAGRALFVAGAAISVGVFIFVLLSIRRAFRDYPLQ